MVGSAATTGAWVGGGHVCAGWRVGRVDRWHGGVDDGADGDLLGRVEQGAGDEDVVDAVALFEYDFSEQVRTDSTSPGSKHALCGANTASRGLNCGPWRRRSPSRSGLSDCSVTFEQVLHKD